MYTYSTLVYMRWQVYIINFTRCLNSDYKCNERLDLNEQKKNAGVGHLSCFKFSMVTTRFLSAIHCASRRLPTLVVAE